MLFHEVVIEHLPLSRVLIRDLAVNRTVKTLNAWKFHGDAEGQQTKYIVYQVVISCIKKNKVGLEHMETREKNLELFWD